LKNTLFKKRFKNTLALDSRKEWITNKTTQIPPKTQQQLNLASRTKDLDSSKHNLKSSKHLITLDQRKGNMNIKDIPQISKVVDPDPRVKFQEDRPVFDEPVIQVQLETPQDQYTRIRKASKMKV